MAAKNDTLSSTNTEGVTEGFNDGVLSPHTSPATSLSPSLTCPHLHRHFPTASNSGSAGMAGRRNVDSGDPRVPSVLFSLEHEQEPVMGPVQMKW